jgi:hypothetical protein
VLLSYGESGLPACPSLEVQQATRESLRRHRPREQRIAHPELDADDQADTHLVRWIRHLSPARTPPTIEPATPDRVVQKLETTVEPVLSFWAASVFPSS